MVDKVFSKGLVVNFYNIEYAGQVEGVISEVIPGENGEAFLLVATRDGIHDNDLKFKMLHFSDVTIPRGYAENHFINYLVTGD